jgi:hypothetical protein
VRVKRNVNKVLAGKDEGRRPLGKPKRRWEDNIKIVLKEIGMSVWTGSMWLKTRTRHEACGHNTFRVP